VNDILETARERAEAVVIANGSPIGLLGSSTAYKQVWARDSMVCALGLMVARDRRGRDIVYRSLETLRAYQSELGNIPHNVGFTGIPDPALVAHGGKLEVGGDAPQVITDTAHAGCIDNSLWYIVGNQYVYALDGDLERLRNFWDSIQRAHLWLRYQDSNECGLLEVHESKDWADLFANRYNSLFPNVLWMAAHRAMARMALALGEDASRYAAWSDDVRFKLNTLLWVGPDSSRDLDWIARHRKEWLYPVKATDALYQERPYYLPYMGFREWCDRFDTLGNLCAVLFGVSSPAQTARIFDFIRGAGVDQPHPIKALHPSVQPGERDWREYYRLRNLPDQYHNGGAWPFIGGFYVAALVQAGRLEDARQQLERLTSMNRLSKTGTDWEFNEWFHGRSGQPMGFAGQSWSAAMYAFAHECVAQGRVPVFGEDA
jgi:glycogen debranching enzyme